MKNQNSWLHIVDCKPSIMTRAVNKFKIGIDLNKYKSMRVFSNALLLVRNQKGLLFNEERVSGVRCYRVRPKGSSSRKVIFYIHGGGFVLGSGAYCIKCANMIARKTGFMTVAVDYRLAPEHPFPAALEDAYCAYLGLLKSGMKPPGIVLFGDSAGGGLCMSLLMKLKDEKVPLPCAAVMLSPAVNFTETGETHITKADKDPIFTKSLIGVRDLYAPGADYKNPYLSPVYGDFTGLPRMLIVAGENEVLLSDSLMAGKKAYSQGVNVSVYVWKEMFHVFPILGSSLPEGKAAMKQIADFIKEQLRP